MQSRSRRKRRRALIWLATTFLLLAGAHALLFIFSFNAFNPFPLLRGAAIGSFVGMVALFIGIWRRSMWARYVLIALVVFTIAGFSSAGVVMVGGRVPSNRRALSLVFGGVFLSAIALIPLVVSRSSRAR